MRSRILAAAAAIFFLFVGFGLFYTQIIRYGYYSRLSKNNSIRIIPIDGPRGTMLDRKGRVLVKSRLSFDIAIVYQELHDRSRLVRILSETAGMSGKSIAAALEKAKLKPYVPVTVLEDIDKDKAILLEELSSDLGGLVIQTRSKRDYPYLQSGSHVFGYLGEVTEDELEGLREYGYRPKDMVGRAGLEKYYESSLKGVDGGVQIEVDSRGRQMRVLGLKEPSNGSDIYLTIDMELQSVCDKLLGESRGAIVVMDPKTGEVLALSSHPAFDPNLFVRSRTTKERIRMLRDRTGRPLSDRAISGLYPPGSVFKIVTASAALDNNKITRYTHFSCAGSYRLGRAKFDCWKEEGHGPQDARGGLIHSCNVFFYNTGRLTGVDLIEEYAKLFGFGKLTGIDLPDEVKGIVPGRAWKRSHGLGAWYEGETLHYAIGQGYLSVTPIQVMCMTAVMANKGSQIRPFIVKRVGTSDISMPKPIPVGLKDSTVALVRAGLSDVINAENGTGKRAKVEGVTAAGKTGTAQNPHGKTHAWFTGFAPYDDPRLCLVVFLEHGGKGGIGAAGIAGEIFKEAKRIGYL